MDWYPTIASHIQTFLKTKCRFPSSHSMDWLKGKPTGNHRFSHGFSYDIWVLKGSQGVSCNFSLKPIHSWMVVWNHGILWLSIYWECHHPNWRTHIFQRGIPPSSPAMESSPRAMRSFSGSVEMSCRAWHGSGSGRGSLRMRCATAMFVV